MSGISTHILDTAQGRPAPGVRVIAERRSAAGTFVVVGEGITDENGRIAQLLAARETLEAGTYRLTFEVGEVFEGQDHFYPQITIQFLVRDPSMHYHVPLLLSPYGYTTYRGS